MATTLISNPRPTTGEELSEITTRIAWLRGKGHLPLGEIPLPPKPESETVVKAELKREPAVVGTGDFQKKPEDKPWGY